LANPRNVVDFTDIGAGRETYKIDNSTITYDAAEDGGSAQVGLAVQLSADGTVALVDNAVRVLGKLIKVEADNKGTVQTKGYTKFPAGTSATLTIGAGIMGDLLVSARGYIQFANPATAAEVAVARGVIIDNDDTANVVVLLD
jgi:hypothetical protein